jgi:hypothetical protein
VSFLVLSGIGDRNRGALRQREQQTLLSPAERARVTVVDAKDSKDFSIHLNGYVQERADLLRIGDRVHNARIRPRVLDGDWPSRLRHPAINAFTRGMRHSSDRFRPKPARCTRNEPLAPRIPDHDRGLVGLQNVGRQIQESLQHVVQPKRAMQCLVRLVHRFEFAHSPVRLRAELNALAHVADDRQNERTTHGGIADGVQ